MLERTSRFLLTLLYKKEGLLQEKEVKKYSLNLRNGRTVIKFPGYKRNVSEEKFLYDYRVDFYPSIAKTGTDTGQISNDKEFESFSHESISDSIIYYMDNNNDAYAPFINIFKYIIFGYVVTHNECKAICINQIELCLNEFKVLLNAIVMQEELNYPRSGGTQGGYTPIFRYIETIIHKLYPELISRADLSTRLSPHTKPKPTLCEFGENDVSSNHINIIDLYNELKSRVNDEKSVYW